MLLIPALITERLLPEAGSGERARFADGRVCSRLARGAVLVAVVFGSMSRGSLLLESKRQAAARYASVMPRSAMALAWRADVPEKGVLPAPSASVSVAAQSSTRRCSLRHLPHLVLSNPAPPRRRSPLPAS